MPTNSARLPIWLDPTDIDGSGNTTLVNNFPVALWRNKGYQGSANDHAQTTLGAKPVFSATGINGTPGILSGVNRALIGPLSPVALQAARHIFVVATIQNQRAGYYYVPRGTPSGAYALFGLGRDSNIVEWNSIDAITTIAAAPAAGLAIVEYVFDGTSSHTMQMFINGVAQTVTNPAATENAAAGSMVANGVSGVQGELRVYDQVQSWDNVQAIRTEMYAAARMQRPVAVVDVIFGGDSITFGLDDETVFGGYRGPLCQMNPRLVPHGLLSTGGAPPPKHLHQGTSGITSTTFLANIASYLASTTKLDAFLLAIGTNADADDATTAANVVGIMTAIWATFPQCKIFVMRIGAFGEASLLARAAVTLARLQVVFAGDPRWFWVDPPIMPATNPGDFWSGDGVHPGHGGYLVLAQSLAQVLVTAGMGP